VRQDQEGGTATNSHNGIEGCNALLERWVFLEQGFQFILGPLDLSLVELQELLVLFAHKAVVMMFGLRLSDRLSLDELLEPLGQGDQLVLDLGGLRGGLRLEALAVVGQHRRVDTVGFGPLALGLGGGTHLGRVNDRDGDFGFMQGRYQVPFVAAGGLTDDMSTSDGLEFLAQLGTRYGCVLKFRLATLDMHLEGGLGDIDSDIDSSSG
jgi:hypothetical protein